MTHNKCCSIIVTHSRKKLLKMCIEHNLSQTAEQDILIIDNASTDGTKEFLSECGLIDNTRVTYKYNEDNIFGAGGFNQGLEYVFSKDFDYAWLMDDDGFPKKNNTLEKILEASEAIRGNAWILNSVVVGNSFSLSFGVNGLTNLYELKAQNHKIEEGIFLDYTSPFNGTLISREAFNRIGNIRSDFVIHGDEAEYIARAKYEGIFVGTVMESLFFHPKRMARDYYNGGIHDRFVYSPPWMEFYEIRNHICIRKWYGSDADVSEYIDGVKRKIICAPYDAKDYDYFITKGIEAGLNEDFTPLSDHPAMKYIENIAKSDADRLLERYIRQAGLLSNWLDRKELGLSIADDLLDRGIKSVAIYGMNELGRHAAIELKESGFDVKYVMDKNPDADNCGYKLLSLDDELEEVDAVIVTIFKWAISVKQALAKKLPDAEIMDIDELL